MFIKIFRTRIKFLNIINVAFIVTFKTLFKDNKSKKLKNTFINNYRIKEAQSIILEDEDFNIQQLALAVGYNSLSAFYKAWDKFVDVSCANANHENEGRESFITACIAKCRISKSLIYFLKLFSDASFPLKAFILTVFEILSTSV